jgi:hypothetical protein
MRRVMRIDSVRVALIKTMPPKLAVRCDGEVPTSGWKNAALGAWMYITPPADGIQDFDFIADPPTGIVLQWICPISTSTVLDRDPSNFWGPGQPLRGVRIHAQNNSIEQHLEDDVADVRIVTGPSTPEVEHLVSSGVAMRRSLGDDLPFPTARIDRGQKLSVLLDKYLRVYRTGDMLTDDYREDRANIELSPSKNRIVDVWFG